MALEAWLRLASFTHWVKDNICTYQRVFLLLTASYGVSTQNPESRQRGKPLNPGFT
jgi:hypothetical protein